MTLDLTIDDSNWASLNLEALAASATSATLTHLNLDPDLCEISLLACDDSRIAQLNGDFRDKPIATNVLSWPATDLAAEIPGKPPVKPEPDWDGEFALGDIAIAYGTCQTEAAAANKPMAEHVTHLIVHGVLHLLGYDHIRDPDATLMERFEVEILGKLGMDDPYRDTDGA